MRKLVALVGRYQVGYIHHQQFSSKELDFIRQEARQCVIYVKVADALSVLRQRAKAYSLLVVKR